MKLFVPAILLIASLAWVVRGGFWSDIIQALQQSGRYYHFFDTLSNVTNDLLTDDGDAAVFICEILQGDIPDALEGLGSAVESEVLGDFEALTSFVESLPTLVPEILSDIMEGGEEAVSIVEELVTNPGAALTVIESGVVSVFSVITSGVVSVFGDITHFFGCDIGGDCPSSTVNGILSSCSTVMDQYSATATSPADQNTVTTATTTQPTPGMGATSSQASQTGSGGANSGNFESNNGSVGNALSTISRLNCIASLFVGLGLGFVLLL